MPHSSQDRREANPQLRQWLLSGQGHIDTRHSLLGRHLRVSFLGKHHQGRLPADNHIQCEGPVAVQNSEGSQFKATLSFNHNLAADEETIVFPKTALGATKSFEPANILDPGSGLSKRGMLLADSGRGATSKTRRAKATRARGRETSKKKRKVAKVG